MLCDIISCNVMRLPSFFGNIWVLPIALNLSSPETEFQFWWSYYFALQVGLSQNQPEPSGWNPVGALVSGASHYLCVDSQAVEDVFPYQIQLSHCLRSKVMIKTQVYGHLYENSICRPESQHCVFCWRILAVQATLPVLKLPFVGSENISDSNLESFSYRAWQWSCRHWILHYFWSCIGHAISPVKFLWSGKAMKSRSKC